MLLILRAAHQVTEIIPKEEKLLPSESFLLSLSRKLKLHLLKRKTLKANTYTVKEKKDI